MGLAAAHRLYLGDDAGEHAAGALHLDPGLDDVLDGGDADALAGLGDVEAEILDPRLDVVILVQIGFDGVGVNIQGTVVYLAFL